MEKTLPILLATLLVFCGVLPAQVKSQSDILLAKLAQFEAAEKLKAEVIVEQKRREVIKTLNSYRDQALKAKDLEKANEIQTKIDDLEAGNIARNGEDPIVGIWKWFNGNNVTFLPDGSSHYVNSRSVARYSWERKPDGTYVLTYQSGNKDTFVLKGNTLKESTGSKEIAERVR